MFRLLQPADWRPSCPNRPIVGVDARFRAGLRWQRNAAAEQDRGRRADQASSLGPSVRGCVRSHFLRVITALAAASSCRPGSYPLSKTLSAQRPAFAATSTWLMPSNARHRRPQNRSAKTRFRGSAPRHATWQGPPRGVVIPVICRVAPPWPQRAPMRINKPLRHCEPPDRAEPRARCAKQSGTTEKHWIASSQRLLAMTGEGCTTLSTSLRGEAIQHDAQAGPWPGWCFAAQHVRCHQQRDRLDGRDIVPAVLQRRLKQ